MKSISITVSWRTLCLVLGATAVGVGLGPVVARATTVSVSPMPLAFAGSLMQNGAALPGPHTLSFTFKKDALPVCSVPNLAVTADAAGQFTVAVPMAGCPSSLFGGSEVRVDISVGGELAIVDQAIASVPAAKYAEQVGYSDCPLGYDRDSSVTGFVLCRHGVDEVVRVGAMSTSFWIDRYEASIWDTSDGTGKQFGDSATDYPVNSAGQGALTTGIYAVSKANVRPSVYMSWFQANVACRLSGKRLPTSEEWLIAAQNTPDPGFSVGSGGQCNTGGSGVRATGLGTLCVSGWGGQDFVGNLSEWTSEWHAALSVTLPTVNTSWGSSWADDIVSNVVSGATVSGQGWTEGVPAATVRGGSFYLGAGAGVNALLLGFSPNYADAQTGVRCVLPR